MMIRYSNLYKHCVASIFWLLLTGCASIAEQGSSKHHLVTGSSPTTLMTTNVIATPGSLMEMPPGNTMGLEKVRVVDEYQAASGKRCRRVVVDEQTLQGKVVCKQQSGEWVFLRELLGNNPFTHFAQDLHPQAIEGVISQTSRSKTESAVTKKAPVLVLAAAAETIKTIPMVGVESDIRDENHSLAPPLKLRMQDGETLWSFALRTTGDANNWEKIADFNNISDTTKLPNQLMLTVPADLFIGQK